MGDPTSSAEDTPFRLEGELPLTFQPREGSPGDRSLDSLCGWLTQNPQWVRERLTRHGALRFRGFAVEGPHDFERIARAIDDELGNDYLGTSPRDALTEYVFNASELPDFYPIPQHCEMSFCARPPRSVFFCCLDEPAEGGGETPLCDFRKVWRELPADVRQRFEDGGIRIVRNYTGKSEERADDPTMLKPWTDMFLTQDREEVEKKCAEEGFEPTWLEGDGLRLVSHQPVHRDHPITGEPVWHNHITTFHVSTAAAELRRIAEFRPSERHRGLCGIANSLEERLLEQAPDERSMHCGYRDGSEFPAEDVEAVRDAVWDNMVIEPWRQGDVVAIDNHSVSHGRLPYEGKRHVAVCWA